MPISSFLFFLFLSFFSSVKSKPVYPRQAASTDFGGANNYFIHAASPIIIQAWVSSLQTSGAKIVRLWVSGSPGGGCDKGTNKSNIPELEPVTLGVYDDTVLDALDKVLALTSAAGIKAIISPHDAGKLKNSQGSTYNGMDLYTQPSTTFYGDISNPASAAARRSYQARLTHILNYTGATSKKRWGAWPAAIAAFDIQNEPMVGLDSTDPLLTTSDWLCSAAKVMKPLLAGPLVATGGVLGACEHGSNFSPIATSCASIDIISIHGFAHGATAGANTFLDADCKAAGLLASAQTANKLVIVEEMGIDPTEIGADSPTTFQAVTSDYTNGGVPWLYWQVIPPPDPACPPPAAAGGDVYELPTTEPALKTAWDAAVAKPAAQSWTAVFG